MGKIAFFNPTLLLKRPIAQISKKVSNSVVVMPRKLFSKADDSLHYSGIDVETYPVINLSKSFEWPIPLYFKGFKTLKENDVVHVWVPFYLSSMFLILLKGIFFPRTRLILTLDTIPTYSFSMGNLNVFFKIYYKTLGKLLFSICDKITLYGESFLKYAEMAGLPMDKIEITPTGIDSCVKKSDKDIKEEFNVKGKLVIGVGICSKRKGIDTFIEISKRVDNVTFMWVGGGNDIEKFKNIDSDVIFTGFRKDVHNFYNQADTFLFPSRGEGLAGVLMEASLYELPIVCSDIPGNRDIVAGFLCDDLDSYVESLRKALNNKKFVKSNKKRVSEKFNWKTNIKYFKRLYR